MILTKVDVGDFVVPQHHNERTRYLQPNAGDTDSGNWDYTWWAGVSALLLSVGIWICLPQRRSQPASIALPLQTGTWPTDISFPSLGTIKPDGFKILASTTVTGTGILNIGLSGGYIVTY